MNTIKKLSSNGFLLEDGWKTVDLNLIKSTSFKYPFENLKVGDKIDNIKYKVGKDKKEYVTDYTLVSSPNAQILRTEEICSPLKATSNSSSSVQDSIRYAQCVNIAFDNYIQKDVDLKFNNYMFLEEIFDLADKIYEEFNKRCLK